MALTNTFRSGGIVTEIPLTDIIHLYGHVITTGNVTHLRKNFTTAGYQVTAGKTLYMVKIIAMHGTAGATEGFCKIGYADNDVGLDTATARTAPVMAFGLDDAADNGLPTIASFGSHQNITMGGWGEGFLWPIAAASKFPFIRGIGTSTITQNFHLWCVEI